MLLWTGAEAGLLKVFKIYLKLGNGEPWAGHNKATWEEDRRSKRLNFVSELNLGAAPEIGSTIQAA